MGLFGWSYPPGVRERDIAGCDGPCDVCGNAVDDCICPECPECGAAGDPKCYEDHGMTRTPEQVSSLAEAQKRWRGDAEAEAKWLESMRDEPNGP